MREVRGWKLESGNLRLEVLRWEPEGGSSGFEARVQKSGAADRGVGVSGSEIED